MQICSKFVLENLECSYSVWKSRTCPAGPAKMINDGSWEIIIDFC